jgi:hypothetical protein
MVLSDVFRNRRRYRGGEEFMVPGRFPAAVQSGAAELPNAI